MKSIYDMPFHKGLFMRLGLAFFVAASLAVMGVPDFKGAGQQAHAQRSAKTAFNLEKVEFDRAHNDRAALQRAKKIYDSYMNSMGVDYSDNYSAFARYISLGPKDEQKYLAFYKHNDQGDECARLGCDFVIFENIGSDRWKKILEGYAHNIWISSDLNQNGLQDVYLQSLYISPEEEARNYDPSQYVNKWTWSGSENNYVFVNEVRLP
jgi:hypothetical protein